ncbi:putative toxin-antitoxin system toxin component, PIN family [Leptospira kobayashii]|uniref:Toxin-antitoxin system toxin component, PIN family n=1 Tax=Leptospira kobayashii TaxID=1917830 RepID=A0ABM7UFV1_9LEPT|nr:putative toxin-antitoxin system toxin component, PIN family [Leptospira kobayashii]BDA77458.1 putative toxin-antitoxin system toxin component, PIN family [Leptospira kobayashii]
MLKILLDTNIYISAILFKGKPREIFQDLIDEIYTGFISREILDEIESTLSKPKFNLNDDFIQIVLSEIRDITVSIKNKPISDYLELRDRNDYHILGAAFSAKVDYIISGDKDLLSLKRIKDFGIISPDEYLKIKEKQN